MTGTRPLRVAAYGFLGMGNLGNEASFAVLLAWLRRELPDASVTCWSAEPETVRAQHGVPGTTLMSYHADPSARGPWVVIRKAWGRLLDVPRTFAMVRGVDVVVVPGMGVLEASLGAHPWGLPYWLFVTALACRIQGRPLVLLGVGADVPRHALLRRFFRWTVRLAAFTTYRDRESAEAMRTLGALGRPGTVHPDLAFAHPVPPSTGVRPGHAVIGVMTYGDDAAERRYTDRMTDLLVRLADDGGSMTLVVGDVADLPLAHRLARAALDRRPGAEVDVDDSDDLDGVLAAMAPAEVVVVSRFHNLIAALLLAKPTVSLGYAAKNSHLLREFGLVGVDQPIDDFDVDTLVAGIDRVRAEHGTVAPRMRELVAAYDVEVNAQLARLMIDVLAPAPEGRGSRRRPGSSTPAGSHRPGR